MPQPRVIHTPKSYWRNKRRESHSDWRFASWRELFQNSIDAGATRISVSLTEEDGKGSWDRQPNEPRVIRIVFKDNGSGITADVMENKFFSPGESTKRDSDGNVGGFGTARTMLCFSQSRYAVRTGKLIVEGDGSEYTIDETTVNTRGTEFEIDISPREEGERNTVENMREALDDYLKYSQLSAKVTVNGEEIKTGTRRGQLARKLVAFVGGRETEFAGVHVSRNEKSVHRGKIVVRVQGTTMFVRTADVPFGVVVEIEPSMARTVLTDSRDSMKWNFENALSMFTAELNRDVRSALDKEDRRKHSVVRGGLGEMLQLAVTKLKNAEWKPAAQLIEHRMETVPSSALRYTSAEEFEITGYGGVSPVPIQTFIDKVKAGEPTFIEGWNNADEVNEFTRNVINSGAGALSGVDEKFGSYIAAGVAVTARQAGVDERYADMHDVHIYKEGISESDNKKLFHAVRRWSPDFWRKEGEPLAGRGIGAHMTLAVWTTCCRYAVNYLASVRPDIVPQGGIRFGTGFSFIKDEDVWNYDKGVSEKNRTAALHKVVDGTHVLLLNPLLSNGEPAYDFSKEGGLPGETPGLADIIATAGHETAHIFKSPHDEEYAGILTMLVTGFLNQDTQKKLRADIRENLDAVRAAYGRGKSRVQILDMEVEPAPEGEDVVKLPRPAERLRVLSSPATTLITGTITAPDNIEAAEEETPALLEYIDRMIARESEGVTVVNCDAAAAVEKAIVDVLVPAAVEQKIVSAEVSAEVMEVREQPRAVAVETAIININPPEVSDTPELSAETFSPLSLAALDIGKPSGGSRARVSEPPKSETQDTASILATLGASGRFAAPKQVVRDTDETASASSRRRIEDGMAGSKETNRLSSLISSGRLAGLAARIMKSAGSLAELPEAPADFIENPDDETVPEVPVIEHAAEEIIVSEKNDAGVALVGDEFSMDDDDEIAPAP